MDRPNALDNFVTGLLAATIILIIHLVVGTIAILVVIFLVDLIPLIPTVMSSWR